MSKVGSRIVEGLKEAKSLDPVLISFQGESNRIEGINRTSAIEVEELARLISVPTLRISDLIDYVAVCQPNAELRDKPSVPGVRVGNHIAPPSGIAVRDELQFILNQANGGYGTPWVIHCRYEMLHPFTDGNGRSGRALWLWAHKGHAPLGFLQAFYYETLQHRRHA